MSRIRGRERLKWNAHVQARGWRWMRVRHHGWHMEMKQSFSQRLHDLEPMTHSHPSLYVRATYALVSCTAPLRWTRKRTSYQHHESQCECSRPHHTLLGWNLVHRDTNSLTPPVGHNGSLSTLNETCNKTKDTKNVLSVHILQISLHIKIGCTPVRRTWELFKNVLFESLMQVNKFASAAVFSVLVPPFLLDTLWSFLLQKSFELIVRVSLHDGGLPRWFGLCTGT